jgi:DNA-binding transcriptional LysR family regulator
MLGDELLIRTPTGMAPTPRAEQLVGPVRHALEEIQLALQPDDFVAAQAERHFAIAVDNSAAIVVAPALIRAAAIAAPGVQLDLRPSGNLNVEDRVDRHEFDLAIGPVSVGRERFNALQLLEDVFVVMLRDGHPAARRPLTAETLAQLPVLEISSGGDDTTFVDRWLTERGLARRIAHRSPFLSTVRLLSETDLVVVVRQQVAEVMAAQGGLQVIGLPFPSPKIGSGMLWHRRFDSHPAHRWLRGLVASAAADASSKPQR